MISQGCDTITRTGIEAFFDKCSCAYDKEKLKRVCSAIKETQRSLVAPPQSKKKAAPKEPQNGAHDEKNDAADQPIAKEDFSRVVRVLYKVVKEIVLTDNLMIEQSRQIRKMEVDEVMEVTAGPSLDPNIGVYRIGVRSFKDDVVGWVTVAGNNGNTFVMPCASIFKARMACPLTAELRDNESEQAIKTLKEGQILELLDWSRTSRSTFGVTRIKVRVQACGTAGWATTNDNNGTVFTAPA